MLSPCCLNLTVILSLSSCSWMVLKALEKWSLYKCISQGNKMVQISKKSDHDCILKSKLFPIFYTTVKIQRGKGNIQICSLYPVTFPLQ